MKITIKGLKSKNENLKKKRKLAREFADPVTMSAGAAVAAGAGILFLGGLIYWIFNKLFGKASQQLKTSMDKVDQAMIEVLTSPPKKEQEAAVTGDGEGDQQPKEKPQPPAKEKQQPPAKEKPQPPAKGVAQPEVAADTRVAPTGVERPEARGDTDVAPTDSPRAEVGDLRVKEVEAIDPAKQPFLEKYQNIQEKIQKEQEEIVQKSKDPKKASTLGKLPSELIKNLFNEIASLKNEMIKAKNIFTDDEINILNTQVEKTLKDSEEYLKQFNRYVLIHSTNANIKDSLYNTLKTKKLLPAELIDNPENWEEFSTIINNKFEVKNA